MQKIDKILTGIVIFAVVLLLGAVGILIKTLNSNKGTSENPTALGIVVKGDNNTNRVVKDEASAEDAIWDYEETRNYKNALSELECTSISEKNGKTVYEMQPHYQKIPIYGRTVTLETDDQGHVTELNANVKDIPDTIVLKPEITYVEIVQIVNVYIEESWQNNQTNIVIPEPSHDDLVIYDQNPDREPCLAYKIVINDGEKAHELIVNAETGEILADYIIGDNAAPSDNQDRGTNESPSDNQDNDISNKDTADQNITDTDVTNKDATDNDATDIDSAADISTPDKDLAEIDTTDNDDTNKDTPDKDVSDKNANDNYIADTSITDENTTNKDSSDKSSENTPSDSDKSSQSSNAALSAKVKWKIKPFLDAEDMLYMPAKVYYSRTTPVSLNQQKLQMLTDYALVKEGDRYDMVDMDGNLMTDWNIKSFYPFFEGRYSLTLFDPMSKDQLEESFISNLSEFQDHVDFDTDDAKYYYVEHGDAGDLEFYYAYNGEIHDMIENLTYADFDFVVPTEPISVQESEALYSNNYANIYSFVDEKLTGQYAIWNDGSFTTDFIYDEIGSYQEGLFAAKKNGKWGYVDEDGNEVIPFEYDASWENYVDPIHRYDEVEENNEFCYAASSGYVPLVKEGVWELRTTKGKLAIAPGTYDKILPVYNGKCWVKKDGKWGQISVKKAKK